MMVSKEDLRLAFLKVLDDETNPISFIGILKELTYGLNLPKSYVNATLKYSGKRKFYMKAKHARNFLLKKKFIQKVAPTADACGGFIISADGKGFLAILR